MTTNEILEEVAQRTSIDRFEQNNATRLIAWLNLSQNTICSRATFPWLTALTRISTAVDKIGSSTVTVDATQASQTVTGTGTTFAATDVGRFIQFSSSNDWYEVTARASNTSITITPTYAPATETGMNFTVRTFSYNLPTDCHKVLVVKQSRTPIKLTFVGIRTFNIARPNQTSTGNPTSYYLFYNVKSTSASEDPNEVRWRISFEPIPDVNMLVDVRYLVRPRQLSEGTDVSIIPAMYHDVLIDGAAYYAYLWSANPNAGGQKGVFEAGIKNMIEDFKTATADEFYVLQPIDSSISSDRLVPFPVQFGDV